MPDYSLGKIYKIICHKTGLVYIGSTCEPTLARRLAGHVANYKQYLKGKTNFTTSFNVIENGVYEIVLIESYSCESKDELYKQESFYIENNICVNKNIPSKRTDEQIFNYNKEYRTKNFEYFKEYEILRKAHKKEYNKEYNKMKSLRNKNKTIEELI